MSTNAGGIGSQTAVGSAASSAASSGDNDGESEMNADDQLMSEFGDMAAIQQHYNKMLAAAAKANEDENADESDEAVENKLAAANKLYGGTAGKNTTDALAQVIYHFCVFDIVLFRYLVGLKSLIISGL